MRYALLLALFACEDPYRSQIGEVQGPDAVAEPDPAARARWTTTSVGEGNLRAVACGRAPGTALVVGAGHAVVEVDAEGQATTAPPAPVDLDALQATADGWIAAGRGALYESDEATPTTDGWRRTALPRSDVLPRDVAASDGDVLWVAGRAPRGATTVGWVARRKGGSWVQRLVEDVPAVSQILPRGGDAILVVESTPYVWRPDAGGAVAYYMPAQPDAHPPIAALTRTQRGFLAVGPDNAWRLEKKTLVRELRQLYLRLEAVAALPGGRAIAVGRDDPPGGRSGGLALGRDSHGRWRRELFLEGTGLHAVAHCGPHTIAAGDGGTIAIRRD